MDVRDLIASNATVVLAVGGLLIGLVFGAVVQRTGFCAMGAVSDMATFGDLRRMRAWLLAGAVAILGAHALQGAGVVALDRTMYMAPRAAWTLNIGGGLVFGFGMVFAGGCPSRNLVRAGSGDLRALLIVLIVGIAAFATIGGVLGPLRVALGEATSLDLTRADMATQGLDVLAGAHAGPGGGAPRLLAAVLVAGALLLFCLASSDFRRSRVHVIAGLAIGLCVVAGWALTGLAFDELADRVVEPASLTFVRPVGDTLDWLQRYSALGWPGFAVTTVLGTVAGAFLAAAFSGSFALATFAGVPDTLRSLAGGVMMGIGGVFAVGCTIGQGVTGLSTLALGSFLALAAIILGALAGLKVMERLAD